MHITIAQELMMLQRAPWRTFLPFQGDLKTDLTQDSIEKIAASLRTHQWFWPMGAWRQGDKLYTLDGHQRAKVCAYMEAQGDTFDELPYLEVAAATEAEALEKLLQLNSRYADINPFTTRITDAAGSVEAARAMLARVQIPEITIPTQHEYHDFEEELDGYGEIQDSNITIVIPLCHRETVLTWLANGETQTAPGLGKGVLKRCGLLS